MTQALAKLCHTGEGGGGGSYWRLFKRKQGMAIYAQQRGPEEKPPLNIISPLLRRQPRMCRYKT